MRTVKLDYYKRSSGKWYSSSEMVASDHELFYDVIDIIEIRLYRGNLPGLIAGAKDYFVLVTDNELTHLVFE